MCGSTSEGPEQARQPHGSASASPEDGAESRPDAANDAGDATSHERKTTGS
jgi:hypothetical protein